MTTTDMFYFNPHVKIVNHLLVLECQGFKVTTADTEMDYAQAGEVRASNDGRGGSDGRSDGRS